MKESGKWVTGSSEEYFSGEIYLTKEDAINGGAQEYGLEPGECFYIGQTADFVLHQKDVDQYLESLFEIEENMEQMGDWSENWLDKVLSNSELKEKIKTKLQEISDLITTTHKPCFFTVDNVEAIPVTEQMMEYEK